MSSDLNLDRTTNNTRDIWHLFFRIYFTRSSEWFDASLGSTFAIAINHLVRVFVSGKSPIVTFSENALMRRIRLRIESSFWDSPTIFPSTAPLLPIPKASNFSSVIVQSGRFLDGWFKWQVKHWPSELSVWIRATRGFMSSVQVPTKLIRGLHIKNRPTLKKVHGKYDFITKWYLWNIEIIFILLSNYCLRWLLEPIFDVVILEGNLWVCHTRRINYRMFMYELLMQFVLTLIHIKRSNVNGSFLYKILSDLVRTKLSGLVSN